MQSAHLELNWMTAFNRIMWTPGSLGVLGPSHYAHTANNLCSSAICDALLVAKSHRPLIARWHSRSTFTSNKVCGEIGYFLSQNGPPTTLLRAVTPPRESVPIPAG